MTDSMRATGIGQGAGDDNGDVVIDLSPDVLKAANMNVGDYLSGERVERAAVPKPIREVDAKTDGRLRSMMDGRGISR